MQSSNDRDTMNDSYGEQQPEQQARSAFPRLGNNPMIKQAIENGEINKSDIDLLEKAQRLTGMGQSLGFFLGSFGGWMAVRRIRPQAKLGARGAGFFFGGMLGSFVGFISGSVAGAMEVNQKMPDSKAKLAKIAQITQKIREQRAEEMRQKRMGQALPPPLPSSNGQQIPRSFPPTRPNQRPYSDSSASPSSPYYPQSTSESSWSSGSTYTASEEAENRREQAGEADRQRNYGAEIKEIERDSQMSSVTTPFDRDPAPSDSYSQSQSPPIGRPQAGRPPGSAWDRLRQRGEQAVGVTRGQDGGAYDGGAASDEGTRTKEQREFDEMLERERRGVGETETWK